MLQFLIVVKKGPSDRNHRPEIEIDRLTGLAVVGLKAVERNEAIRRAEVFATRHDELCASKAIAGVRRR